MVSAKNITLDFWNRTDRFIRKFGLIKKRSKALVAFSGGPDSLALLHYLVKRRKDLEILACHVNHGIRGKSAEWDLAFSRNFCKKNGVAFVSTEIDVPAIAAREKKSLEHAARNERYAFLLRTARRNNCLCVCTAHHADDNAETVLLNLLRGASARGLKGIPVRRPVSKDLYIARPLLWAGKKDILLYLKANGLRYRKDHTNEDEKHTRNWIRKKLLPMIEKKQPRFREHLTAIAWELNRMNFKPDRCGGKETCR